MTGQYAAVLEGAGGFDTRAHDMLDALRARARSSASAISLWDPIARTHVTLANHGYPDAVIDHLNTWFVDNDPLFDSMRRRDLGALRWRDFPDYRSGFSVTEVFRPAGFDEGLSARLVTVEGRYAGTIHVNCDDARYPTDDDVREINSLRRQMADYLDFSVRPRQVADLLAPEAQAWAVDQIGRAHLLRPGAHFDRPVDARLVSDMALAHQLIGGHFRPEATRWHDGSTWLHVRHLATAPRYAGDSLRGLLLIARAELPFGVTPRELDVLTLASLGLTNNQIAAQLFISARTAGHHMENVIGKLRAANRASCVSAATSWGLVSGPLLADLAATPAVRELA
ncbi:helix-turn-helix transcriptional regulator [Mycobacterium sp. SMC-4]|uniref:helix-turn-helix transcriptional regulator n=1 Tax=Mycobacterium sp. SMC-4 TaxID=2857059 RepID=UPI0021B409C5|nr:helix-turn-helix transcriptional regulator [Mycobacterium sp. SMC-4]UXA20955.1 helix-turn-helix transcriptional regulator [Mycobacterium sp. SMC-4]